MATSASQFAATAARRVRGRVTDGMSGKAVLPEHEGLLVPPALRLIRVLHKQFGDRREELLDQRASRTPLATMYRTGDLVSWIEAANAGKAGAAAAAHEKLGMVVAQPPAHPALRSHGPTWPRLNVSAPAHSLLEMTDALNSGAPCVIADFEDGSSPTFANQLEGQRIAALAARGELEFWMRSAGCATAAGAREHRVAHPASSLLVARPRGLHVPEHGLWIVPEGTNVMTPKRRSAFNARATSAALVDFALFAFHYPRGPTPALPEGGSQVLLPVCLPKIESALEAKFWNEVFETTEDELGLPRGVVRPLVMIDSLPGLLQLGGILRELRTRACGVGCASSDFLSSWILEHRDDSRLATLPDRKHLTAALPFMRAYSNLVVRGAAERGADPLGDARFSELLFLHDDDNGKWSAEPSAVERRWHAAARNNAREALCGFRGTHLEPSPEQVEIATKAWEAFGRETHMAFLQGGGMHELFQFPDLGADTTAAGPTTAGVRDNLLVGTLYLESWLNGRGTVRLFGQTVTASTAELCRAQLWGWMRHGARLADTGELVTPELCAGVLREALFHEEDTNPSDEKRPTDRRELAVRVFLASCCSATSDRTPQRAPDSLTTFAYDYLEPRFVSQRSIDDLDSQRFGWW